MHNVGFAFLCTAAVLTLLVIALQAKGILTGNLLADAFGMPGA